MNIPKSGVSIVSLQGDSCITIRIMVNLHKAVISGVYRSLNTQHFKDLISIPL